MPAFAAFFFNFFFSLRANFSSSFSLSDELELESSLSEEESLDDESGGPPDLTVAGLEVGDGVVALINFQISLDDVSFHR